jgi:hypothetical protein
MDEETKRRLLASLSNLIDWMEKAGQKGGDFVAEQAPLVAQEIVRWKLWSSVFIAVFMIVLLIAALVTVKWAFKGFGTIEDKETRVTMQVLSVLAGLALTIAVAIVVPVNAYEAIKAAVAPRLVILETLHGLVK